MARKFHPSAGAGAGNAAIAAACLPVSIVLSTIGEILPILPPKRNGLAIDICIFQSCIAAVSGIFHSAIPPKVTYKGIE